MNGSGIAVKEALAFFGKTPADLLVVLDDMALPLGKLRLRANGSSGGHNGLESVIYQLQSEEFSRLRLGIGTPGAKEAAVGHVLGEFSREEKKTDEEMMETAVVLVETCYQKGYQTALNYLSRWASMPGEVSEEK
jgi:PTH1 family peptidyl-tRNA hydrolase